MSKTVLLTLLLCTGVTVGQNKPGRVKPETPPIDFVKEYVRELISDEGLKTTGVKEFGEAKTPNEQLSTSLYVSKSAQLELRSHVRMLKGMRLGKPFDTLIPDLIGFYQRQIELHQNLIDISTKFLAGPQSSADYPALMARVPQIRAELDATRKAIFEAAALVFMTLIDQKPDSQGNLSHLVITRAEKSELQDQLEIMLKDEPEKGDHDYYISAAMILQAGLQKGHKCADEPWE